MSTKANYFKIGVFIIAVLAMLVVGIIVLSAGILTKDTLLIETYIDEPVQGLSVGSPVHHRGVRLGTVKQITFLPTAYPEEMAYGSQAFEDYSRYVLVVMSVDRSNFPKDADDEVIWRIIKGWVLKGLRLKVSYLGITGLSYIEADYPTSERDPDEELEITWDPRNIYIPATPSLHKNLIDSIQSVLKTFNKIEFEDIAALLKKTLTTMETTLSTAETTLSTMDTTLSTVDKAITGAEIPKVGAELVGLVADLRATNQFIVGLLDKSQSTDGVNIPETIAQLDTTLRHLDRFVATQQSEMGEIMGDIRIITVNIRDITENLKKYPGLILGGPPPEVSK